MVLFIKLASFLIISAILAAIDKVTKVEALYNIGPFVDSCQIRCVYYGMLQVGGRETLARLMVRN